jgi:hypothetical protein
VRRFNTDLLGELADLGEFLFGSERAAVPAGVITTGPAITMAGP